MNYGRKKTLFKAPTCLGYLTKARSYYPLEKKLDSRITSEFFIGYPKKSKEYKFYYPNRSIRIVEFGNAKFIKNGEVSRSMEHVKWKFKKLWCKAFCIYLLLRILFLKLLNNLTTFKNNK